MQKSPKLPHQRPGYYFGFSVRFLVKLRAQFIYEVLFSFESYLSCRGMGR